MSFYRIDVLSVESPFNKLLEPAATDCSTDYMRRSRNRRNVKLYRAHFAIPHAHEGKLSDALTGGIYRYIQIYLYVSLYFYSCVKMSSSWELERELFVFVLFLWMMKGKGTAENRTRLRVSCINETKEKEHKPPKSKKRRTAWLVR